MTNKTKLNIKRTILLIVSFILIGGLGFLLIDGIANHDLAESKVIVLIVVLMLLIPLALVALLFTVMFKNNLNAIKKSNKIKKLYYRKSK